MRPLLLSLLLATSCGTTTTTWVGTVDGTDVAVGIVSDGSNVALFFCGGATSFTSSTKWLRFAGSASSFTATQDTWSASGAASGSTVSGTVDRGDGVSLTWSAKRADDGSVVGLYESVTSTSTSGIVVRSDTDVQGAFIDKQQSTIEQIIPIFPLDLESQGLHVTISGQDAFVPRATLP